MADDRALRAAWAAVTGTDTLSGLVRGLIMGYHNYWKGEPWRARSVEEEFEIPVVNPSTNRPSRTWTHAGKRDGVVVQPNGMAYLLEHKTTTEDIEDPGATYWKRLVIDSQVSGYVLAHWQEGLKLSGTVYDVIRRPGIRPKKIPKKSKEGRGDQVEMTERGRYFGFRLHAPEMATLTEEDDYLFSLRVARETIENPNRYFQRRVIPRLDNDLLEYAHELWQIGVAMRDCRRVGRWYRNSKACTEYGRPCEYLDLCSGHDTPDSDRWVKVGPVHDELVTGSNDALTNSRITTFQTCRRKCFYRYETGLRPREVDEGTALNFGRLMHEALEAWWQTTIDEPQKLVA